MQLVLNKLDLDQWGYGNNQANLDTQVKRLAPIANDSAAQAALASTTSVLNSVGERLSVLRGDVAMAGLDGNGRQMGSDNTGWVKVLGTNSSAKSIGLFDGYKVTNSGLVAGADAKVGDGVVGGSFSYVTSSISQQDFRLGDTGKMNSGTLAIYGTQEYGDVFVDGALAFSKHSLDSKRVTALARVAQADVDLNQTTLKLTAGYRIGIDGSQVNVLTPMLSVEAANLKQKAYTESGADALSLNVDSKTSTRTRTSLGLRFNTTIEGSNTTFYPELMVAMNRNNGTSNTNVVAHYMGDSSAEKLFTTNGVVLPKSSYTLGAGLRFATSKSSEMQIGYRFEGGHGLSSRSAQLRGAWSF
jgi:outer membrane autotransporter protein